MIDQKFFIRNSILFELEQKFEISESIADETYLVEAMSANKELSRYGYSLNTQGIFALAHNSAETIKTMKDHMCRILDDVVGLSDYSMSETFYPNFPEEVMEKDEMELALNAMLYYLFSQTDDEEMNAIAYSVRNMVTEESAERILRKPLTDIPEQSMKIIGYAKCGELEQVLYSMTQALSISESKEKLLEKYIENYPEDWVLKIFGSEDSVDLTMPSHEIRSQIAYLAYINGKPELANRMLLNTEDVLRLAAVISKRRNIKSCCMDANLSVEVKNAVFSLSRQDKKALKGFLESKPDLFTSVWHREKMWEKLMGRLDTRDDNYPRVKRVFDNLRNNNRVQEDGSPIVPSAWQALERLMKAIEKNPDNSEIMIEEFADKYPRVFARNIKRIARELSPGSNSLKALVQGIEKNCGSVPAVQLLKLKNNIEQSDGWDLRVFTNQKGKTYAVDNKCKKTDIKIKCSLMDAVDRVLIRSMAYKPVGKVYIDPALATITAPLRNVRNASKGATLTKYSVIAGEKEKNLAAFGIFWKNAGKERADIDLSVTGFAEGYASPQIIYYGILKNTWGVHSGDYTSGEISKEINGAVEYIFVDKKKCLDNGIRYIIPEVHGFNIPFSEADDVRFCFMEKEGNLNDLKQMEYVEGQFIAPTFKGQLIEPTEIKTSYRLTQNARTATPLLYDLKEDQFIWIDANINVGGVSNAVNSKVLNKTAIILFEAKHNDYPDMKTLFTKYTEVNGGELTEDITEADLVVTFGNADRETLNIKEDAEVISSLELDRISAEFCNLMA